MNQDDNLEDKKKSIDSSIKFKLNLNNIINYNKNQEYYHANDKFDISSKSNIYNKNLKFSESPINYTGKNKQNLKISTYVQEYLSKNINTEL